MTAPGLEGLYRASCSGRPRSRGMPLVDREADAGNSAEPVGLLPPASSSPGATRAESRGYHGCERRFGA